MRTLFQHFFAHSLNFSFYFSIFSRKSSKLQLSTTHSVCVPLFWKQHFNKSFLLPFTFFSPARVAVAISVWCCFQTGISIIFKFVCCKPVFFRRFSWCSYLLTENLFIFFFLFCQPECERVWRGRDRHRHRDEMCPVICWIMFKIRG